MNVNPAVDEFRAFQEKNNVPAITRTDSDGYTSEESVLTDSSARSSRSTGASMAAAAAAPVSIPHTLFDANTGPKGVIADAQNFTRARKTSFRQTFTQLSNGLAEKVTSRQRSTSRQSRRSKSHEDSGSSEDEEFLRRWRENRMAELSSGQKDIRTRRNSPSKRRYGRLTAVDALGYLDAIEKVTKDTVVVVLINDPDSPVSSFVEDALSNVARKHETTRFIKLGYEDAEIDPAGVPAVLAYMNGELFATVMSVVDEMPEGRTLSPISLEQLLKAHQILY